MNYKAIYDRLIAKAKSREAQLGRMERHHVKPKCLGGSERPANLVKLTPEEHYLAHQLLVKIYPNNGKLIWASLAMTGTGNGEGNGRKGNKLYGWLRRRFCENQKGRKFSEETKRKIGEKSRARMQGENHPLWGTKHSAETRAKISAANTGKRRTHKFNWTEDQKRAQSVRVKAAFASGKRKPHVHKFTLEQRAKMKKYWNDVFSGALGEEIRQKRLLTAQTNAIKGGAARHKAKLERLQAA